MNTAGMFQLMVVRKDGKFLYYLNDVQVNSEDLIGHINYLSKPVPKPEPKPATLEERVKKEYGDYEVVMLGFGDTQATKFLGLWKNPYQAYIKHIEAQSMRGFAGYLYEFDSNLIQQHSPTEYIKGKTVHPIAVLFSRGQG